MPAPASAEEFLDLVQKAGVVDEDRLKNYLKSTQLPDNPADCADLMVRDALLTPFQTKQLLAGRYKRFRIGNKYRLLEMIGAGGMGAVYLCEHLFMRRLVALKVLPNEKMSDASAVDRFYREARVAAAVNDLNIVRSFDLDFIDNLHCLVMEYIDGTNLQDIVSKHGRIDVWRSADYVAQAAMGLQHAHEARLVHRDIKPGNLLLERSGTIKVLDLGLARFFGGQVEQKDNVTEKYDEKGVLGTADYLAPEQAMNSRVDIRADIYSLGSTWYFMLTGKAPFEDGSVAQKLIWHQMKEPKPVTDVRQDVPPELIAILKKMMAKKPEDRFQTPREVAEALAPHISAQQIPLPNDYEMPKHCPAILRLLRVNDGDSSESGIGSPGTRRLSQVALSVSARTGGTGAMPALLSDSRQTPGVVAAVTAKHKSAVGGDFELIEDSPSKSKPRKRPVTPEPEESVITTASDSSSQLAIYVAVGAAVLVMILGGLGLYLLMGSSPQPKASSSSTSPPTVASKAIKPSEAKNFVDKVCTVEYVVRSTGTSAGRVFLNSEPDFKSPANFTTVYSKMATDKFKVANPDKELRTYFQDKTIRVTGTVKLHGNNPQIEVNEPNQVEVIDG